MQISSYRHYLACVFSLLIFFCRLSPNGLRAESGVFEEVTGIDGSGNVEKLYIQVPSLVIPKREIYHHEILNVYLYGIPADDPAIYTMKILRKGRAYPSVGNELTIPFKRARGTAFGRLKAVYLPDWNEEEGEFRIELYRDESIFTPKGEAAFRLLRRKVPPLVKTLSVVDLEMNNSIRRRSFTDSMGSQSDYRAILDWARFMQADAIWILSGETTSFDPYRTADKPWDPGPLENLRLLKESAGQYGVQVGSYIMCFYVPGDNGVPPGYPAATGYRSETDSLYSSPHISLLSERRIQDIIELARRFQKDREISYIGFDFIRTGRVDGYELGPLVVEETNIDTPPSWPSLSEEEKIKWFARSIEVDKDPLVIEKWRWWRAHRVASIIQRIITEAGITKPVWVYTLGWNHGKEHGQDPVMFFDSGVTIDAVMLYEATRKQFERLLGQWKGYFRAGQGNIVAGNCIDQRLLDSDTLSPPDELRRINVEGYENMVRGGYPAGLFLHDMSRAYWGRKGGYSIDDYVKSFVASIQALQQARMKVELAVEGALSDVWKDSSGKIEISGHLLLTNKGPQPLQRIRVNFFDGDVNANVVFFHDGIATYDSSFTLGQIGSSQSVRLDFSLLHEREVVEMGKIGFRIGIEEVNIKSIYMNELPRITGAAYSGG
jgi:hypothetical protein